MINIDNGVNTFLEDISRKELSVLRTLIKFSETPDALADTQASFKNALTSVANKVEELRRDLGVPYGKLSKHISRQIEN